MVPSLELESLICSLRCSVSYRFETLQSLGTILTSKYFALMFLNFALSMSINYLSCIRLTLVCMVAYIECVHWHWVTGS